MSVVRVILLEVLLSMDWMDSIFLGLYVFELGLVDKMNISNQCHARPFATNVTNCLSQPFTFATHKEI